MFELTSERKISTVHGDALLVEFSTEVDSEHLEGKLIIPQRVSGEVEGCIPIVMVYFGVKMSKRNKEFHDLKFIDAGKQVGKHISKINKVGDTSTSAASTLAAATAPPTNVDEDAQASFSDVEKEADEEVWIPSKCSETDECNMGVNVCYGYCVLCCSHMPYNGSQCRCSLKGYYINV